MNSPQAKHNIENCDPKTHIIIKGARVHNLKGGGCGDSAQSARSYHGIVWIREILFSL